MFLRAKAFEHNAIGCVNAFILLETIVVKKKGGGNRVIQAFEG